MRIVLVLGAVAALVLLAWLALGTGTEPARVEPIAPRTVPEGSVAPLVPADLTGTQRRESAPHEPRVDLVERVAAAKFTAVDVVFALLDENGAALTVPTQLECADPLARVVAAESDGKSSSRWRCADLMPGPHTVAVTANGRIPLVRVVDVTGETAEQLVELRVAAAPLVRVRWQTETGAPFLAAMQAPDTLATVALVRVAVDTRRREVGEAALTSRRTLVHAVTPGERVGTPREPPWAGAPADAVGVLEFPMELPAFVHGSVDGVVVASERVEAGASEVVLRTAVAVVQSMRATVRFCVVDGSTGERISDAQFSATTRAGIGRSLVDVGAEGCRSDPRFTVGSWLLTFTAPGRGSIQRAVEFRRGDSIDLGEVRFAEQGELVVRARRPDGSPAAGVKLAVLAFERFAWGESTRMSTDPQGVARFVGLPDEAHVLVVADPRATGKPQKFEPQSVRGIAPLDIVVEDGVEVVLDFGPQALLMQRAYLHDGSGMPMAAQWLPVSGLVPTRLLPGTYIVELEDAKDARAIEVGRESAIYEIR